LNVKIPRAVIPGLVTVGNLFMGFYAVICAVTGRIALACWCIIIAAILDAVDGKVARLTKTSSRFGVEYDSLADVVSFGFAPSFLIYILFSESMGFLMLLLSFLPLLAGSLRLARFNIQTGGSGKTHFVGYAIPSAAITLASFILFSLCFYDQPLRYPAVMLILVVTVSVLMVSTVRYELMPNLLNISSLNKKLQLVLGLVLLVILVPFPRQTLFPLMIVYLLSGLIRWMAHLFFYSKKGESSLESKS
jgi:CDP-diacylglycerol--serine O-phosphatidyltransferase